MLHNKLSELLWLKTMNIYSITVSIGREQTACSLPIEWHQAATYCLMGFFAVSHRLHSRYQPGCFLIWRLDWEFALKFPRGGATVLFLAAIEQRVSVSCWLWTRGYPQPQVICHSLPHGPCHRQITSYLLLQVQRQSESRQNESFIILQNHGSDILSPSPYNVMWSWNWHPPLLWYNHESNIHYFCHILLDRCKSQDPLTLKAQTSRTLFPNPVIFMLPRIFLGI